MSLSDIKKLKVTTAKEILDGLPKPKTVYRLERVELREEPKIIVETPSFFELALAYIKFSLLNQVRREIDVSLDPTKENIMETKKPFWLSKTFWLNVLGILLVFVGPLLGLPTSVEELGPDTVAGFFTVLNLVLRFFTKSEVGIK